MKMTVLAAAMALTSTAVLAGDLINKDSKKHDTRISCGAGTTAGSIAGNTIQSGAVKAGCEIEAGGAKHKVKGNGNVTIKDGKMSE